MTDIKRSTEKKYEYGWKKRYVCHYYEKEKELFVAMLSDTDI